MGQRTVHKTAQQTGLFKKKLVGPVLQQLSGERAVVAGNVMIVT